jgi:hypothetical protein
MVFRTPEVEQAPSWFRDGLVDAFAEDRVVRNTFKSVSPEVVSRLRRRQFNANRDLFYLQRAMHLADSATGALRELAQVEPEMAEALIRQEVEAVLGGRVVVPSDKRKINRKD